MSDIERGVRVVSAGEVFDLALTLQTHVDDLFDPTGPHGGRRDPVANGVGPDGGRTPRS